MVAEKAGVGVGTVYRHFPTKERLFEAIMVDAGHGTRGRCAGPASRRTTRGTAFFDFFDHLVTEVLLKRDLITAIAGAGVEFDVVAADAKAQLNAAVTELLVAAQDAGTVRSDVTAPVVLSLVSATCMAAKNPHPGGTVTEMLTVVRDGLRTST